MLLISHRGNLTGSAPESENRQDWIERALAKGFDVEIDVWMIEDRLYLGHDGPTYRVDAEFLRHPDLWCHAKNFEALRWLNRNFCHHFWHQKDDYTLTSGGYIWTYPGGLLSDNSIAVMPESYYRSVESLYDLRKRDIAGICSDFIEKFT